MTRECSALYSGSFDPFHNGHRNLVKYISSLPFIKRTIVSVTPQNPLKNPAPGASGELRLKMAQESLKANENVFVSDFEFRLPEPHYSINALERMAEMFPDTLPSLVIGSDSWNGFRRWYRWEDILNKFGIIIYPRPGYEYISDPAYEKNIIFLPDAPISDISSSLVREKIKAGKSISGLVSKEAAHIILNERLYTG